MNELNEKLILNENAFDDFVNGVNDTAGVETQSEPTDWKKELASVGSNEEAIAAVWKKFFGETFGWDHIDAVNNLGKAVRVECTYLGFNDTLNPFIGFINTLINDGLISEINSAEYSTIHNCYGRYGNKDYLSEADIRGTGKFGKKNLVFRKDLYTKAPSEIEEYLYLQNILSDYKNNSVKYHKSKDDTDPKDTPISEYFDTIFFTGDKLNSTESIRTAFKIDNIYNANVQTNKSYDANTGDAEIDSLAKELVNRVGSAGAIMYLVAKFGNTSGFNVDNALKNIPDEVGGNMDLKKVSKELITINNKYFNNAKMTAAVLNKLIDKILAISSGK